LYSVEQIATGRGPLLPPTPLLFTSSALPYAISRDPPLPTRWIHHLNEWFGGDVASIRCLQEYVGYLLTDDTRLHSILLMIGPPRSGKGTILRVITRLLGAANVASPTLSRLGARFGLADLAGKRLAI